LRARNAPLLSADALHARLGQKAAQHGDRARADFCLVALLEPFPCSLQMHRKTALPTLYRPMAPHTRHANPRRFALASHPGPGCTRPQRPAVLSPATITSEGSKSLAAFARPAIPPLALVGSVLLPPHFRAGIYIRCVFSVTLKPNQSNGANRRSAHAGAQEHSFSSPNKN
jgi:hypothetical protein